MSYFTGDVDDVFTSEQLNDLYIFSNGIDVLHYWDGSATTTTILPGCELIACKKMVKLGERLCLYNTTETGNACIQRVRWSAAGTPGTVPATNDWTKTGSGFSDLVTQLRNEAIVTAERMGNYVIIYGKNDTVLQEYKNDVNNPFAFLLRVPDNGIIAPRAIIVLGENHFLLTSNDVCLYDGGRSMTSIGSEIRDELFGIINPQYASRSFMTYDENENEIKLHIPTGGNSIPNVYFRYNLINKSWVRGTRTFTGWGKYEEQTALTIDEMTGAIDSYSDLRFDDITVQAINPIVLVGDANGIVYKEDTLVHNLNATAIVSSFESKDIVIAEDYPRFVTNWMELNFEGKGNACTIAYSTDYGATWSSEHTVSMYGEWACYNYDFEVNSPIIRFRWTNATASSTFSLRMFEVGYIKGSDRGKV